ncbi:MAG: hypothetical protein RDV48_03450 [Candidatus Eremiobacteraeota bacterium]|nr:hypothetical protein [Candidatus Eremiobacteraeota bacterium]
MKRSFCQALAAILILAALAAGNSVYAAPVKFQDKMLWIQLGNQIKDIDDAMLEKIAECGFSKVILLHSSINEQGYFPVLRSLTKRCHAKKIKVSMGTLVFKDTYQKPYWLRNPGLRKCDRDGKYSDTKYYHYQICPNNPVNHEYAAGLLLREAQEAGVDEIHIDYEIEPCFCPYCVADFQEKHKKDPRVLSDKDRDWLVWRSRKTRDFFEVLARKCYGSFPTFLISATAPVIGLPGGFTAYGTDLRYEDLTQYVDEFQPMIYLSVKTDPSVAGDKFAAIQRRVLDKYVVPGIIINEEGTMQIKTRDRLMAELEGLARKGAKGIAVFEVRYINDELKGLLRDL